MRHGHKVGVVIPALNEAAAIGRVIGDIPAWVDTIVVADNGSTDGTPEVAGSLGARVTIEPDGAYGAACLAGIAALPDCSIIAFVDGDYADYPDRLDLIVDPIARDEADLVIGSRRLGRTE
ncbi:MAG: glycosyltransferase family 2 protein, partial [Aestuariivirgaceae bacterium]